MIKGVWDAITKPGSYDGSIWDGKSNPYSGKFGMKPIKMFADGGLENHTAQISYPTSTTPIRIWQEPETGGEAYLPLSINKRTRSIAILREVNKIFGDPLRVEQYANGGVVGGGGGNAPTFNINNHYPVAEPTSVTVNRALSYAGFPGLESE
jgi:hypothetical protein